jgi:hypothetical protein
LRQNQSENTSGVSSQPVWNQCASNCHLDRSCLSGKSLASGLGGVPSWTPSGRIPSPALDRKCVKRTGLRTRASLVRAGQRPISPGFRKSRSTSGQCRLTTLLTRSPPRAYTLDCDHEGCRRALGALRQLVTHSNIGAPPARDLRDHLHVGRAAGARHSRPARVDLRGHADELCLPVHFGRATEKQTHELRRGGDPRCCHGRVQHPFVQPRVPTPIILMLYPSPGAPQRL